MKFVEQGISSTYIDNLVIGFTIIFLFVILFLPLLVNYIGFKDRTGFNYKTNEWRWG